MEIDLIELKGQARAAMDQADPSFRAVTLVYILMTTGVAFLLSLIPVPADPETGLSFVSLFLTILYNLYAAAAGFGPDRSRAAQPGEDAWELVFWKKEV